ncbi:DUF6344 domain-containing protein [Streptomyces apocyni]|uniref:DUF6344 domain-containing protein n=1 Tax=Streptomyces apocyni TaxID=2654677 RepID=UPI002D7FB195|nr:DUF6344 domain-containing protein [Streptomyces apocyni]
MKQRIHAEAHGSSPSATRLNLDASESMPAPALPPAFSPGRTSSDAHGQRHSGTAETARLSGPASQ